MNDRWALPSFQTESKSLFHLHLFCRPLISFLNVGQGKRSKIVFAYVSDIKLYLMATIDLSDVGYLSDENRNVADLELR